MVNILIRTVHKIILLNALSLAMLFILYLIAIISVLHAKMVFNQESREEGKESSLLYPVNIGHFINKYTCINMY